ncbi:MAG TPA: hypothetical protein VE596_19545 [Gaiellaceae bacterium]|jgi:hypothetical protein|nr:hypothetical protein [Gaiellaceae bacterium]
MAEDDRTEDTRELGGAGDEPLMITKAELVEAVNKLDEDRATWGSYATEAPTGAHRTDWPRDYATD